MKYYYGSDKILSIKLNGEWLPAACVTDNPMTEDANFLPTSTRETDGWETSRPVGQKYSISFSGLQILTGAEEGTPELISYDRLKVLKRARTLIEWKLETIDLSLLDSGFAYIGSLGEASPVDGWLTYDCTLVGVGKPTDLITNGNGTQTGGGAGSIPGGGLPGGNPGGGGSSANQNNRFRIIYMVDENDLVVSKIKTNDVDSFEVWSKNNVLLLRMRDGDITPPYIPQPVDVNYMLNESFPFLDLNLHFRGSLGANADYFNEGTGIVGLPDGVKPKEGETVTVEVSYNGGQDPGTGVPVPVWDSSTRVTLTLKNNGVVVGDPVTEDYHTPPPAGVLFGTSFVPELTDNWTAEAKVERIQSFMFINYVGSGITFIATDVNNGHAIVYNQVDHPGGTYNYLFLLENYEETNIQINNNSGGQVRLQRFGAADMIINNGSGAGFLINDGANNNIILTAV